MNVYEAMQERRSIRKFLPKPIDDEKLKRALRNAQRAPSWKNVQPYEVHAVAGTVKDSIALGLLKRIEAKEEPHPDEPYQSKWPTYMKRRMFQLGNDLYNFIGISRDDKKARENQFLENYSFFGAPMALFFFTEKEMGFWPEFDVGIFYGYVMLALQEEGIASCPQASVTIYPDFIRETLGLPENKKLLAGMSIGYEAPAKINQFRSSREDLEEILTIHR